MANPEHVEVVKQGAASIAAWNEEHLGTRINLNNAGLEQAGLQGAKLYRVSMSEANLRRANLQESYLVSANMSGVNLSFAYLMKADLALANLSGADLSGADLRGANLRGANLSRAVMTLADLSEVNFNGADLSGADLGWASLSETIFANTNLSYAKELEDCTHLDPCHLDPRTLFRSGGLPEVFLRGCGWPEEQIKLYLYGNTIAIAFKHEIWGQLIPIEYALATTLGDKFAVEKHSNQIIVKLESPELLQEAFDAVIPVVASLERVAEGEVDNLAIKSREHTGQLAQADLKAMLGYLIQRFDTVPPPGQKQLTFTEKSVVEAVKGVPFAGDLLSYWIQTGLEKRVTRKLYDASKEFFQGAKGIAELPSKKEPRQLPPAGYDEDSTS